MARNQSIEIRKILNRIVPKSHLEELAKETGAWSRNRKISAPAFFWSVVLGFSAGNHRTLAGLRRSFGKSTGRNVVASAFYDRFSPNFVKLLKKVLEALMNNLATDYAFLKESFSHFQDILITDSSLIRLHDALEKAFPSIWTNHTKASIKAHVVMSVKGGGPKSVQLTSGSTHDGSWFKIGPWVKHHLLIFDLGFYRYHLFSEIEQQGGYYLSRLKAHANPTIIKFFRNPGPISKGRNPLEDHMKYLAGKPLDIEVELVYNNRWRKQKGTHRIRARIVGVFNKQTAGYHLYITNIPADVLSAEDTCRVYSARWLIELLFRELKTQYRLGEIPSRKKHIVESLIYASLITIMASRVFLLEIKKISKLKFANLPEERWAALWTTIAPDLLTVYLRPYPDRLAEKYLWRMICHESVDPNKSRKLLMERAFA